MAKGLEELRIQLVSGPEQAQTEALRSLASMKDDSICDYCAQLLCHGTDYQKAIACIALARLATPRAVDLLQTICASADRDVRLHAAYSLALAGNRSGESTLIDLLPIESNRHWRMTIIACLASFGHAQHLSYLKDIVNGGSKRDKDILRSVLSPVIDITQNSLADWSINWESLTLSWIHSHEQKREKERESEGSG